MAIGSVLAGILSFLLVVAGLVLTVVPVLGSVTSFSAPIVAIVGVVLGGIALSRARRDGEPTGLALAGTIVSGVALIPALLIALTCGMCNACVTAGVMRGGVQHPLWRDGGLQVPRWPPDATPVLPGAAAEDAGLDAGAADGGGVLDDASAAAARPAAAPPPAFPPPPFKPR